MNILYRTESFSGSGERDAATVMSFEIFELLNTDILETLSNTLLGDHPISLAIGALIKAIEAGDEDLPEYDDEVAIGFCHMLLDLVEEKTSVKVRYALWLTTKDTIASYYGKDMNNPTDYSAYETSSIILSGPCADGTLYGYSDCPEPLDITLEPIEVTNSGWAT